LDKTDAVLVVASSLMVYAGFRFVQAATRAGKLVAAMNLGAPPCRPSVGVEGGTALRRRSLLPAV